LALFKTNKFFPISLIIKDVGVTIKKKTTPITIGDATLPNKIPNLNQILLNGVKIIEFNRPKIRKIIAIIIDQTLIFPLSNKGYIATIKKNKKKTIPKLLFVPTLILLFFKLN
tara:strand:- start:295 stop:633 length:339 start_codon:yes stop_codon:yes gene_type:complete